MNRRVNGKDDGKDDDDERGPATPAALAPATLAEQKADQAP